jgi:hypothetical protein
MTNKLAPCPFCGMQSHQDWDDTMYHSGTGWREDLKREICEMLENQHTWLTNVAVIKLIEGMK